jgi:NAD(P)H-dependent FMN reductase
MKKIIIITASRRPLRNGEKVTNWVYEQSKLSNLNLLFEVVDLRELDLPFIDEPSPPMSVEEYTNDHTKKWSGIVKEADGFIIVVPEYNRGYPASIKNAIDYLYKEWNFKPVGLIGYGGSGARDSIRQLREILLAMKLKPLYTQIGISDVWSAFDENGNIFKKNIQGNIQKLFTELYKSL